MTFVTKADVKPFLGMKQTDNDADVTVVIAAAEAAVAADCGPLESVATTARVAAGNEDFLRVPGPIDDAETVTVTELETGNTYVADDEDIDYAAGVIYADVDFGDGLYEVVYHQGRTTVPADLKQAVVYMTAWMWLAQRGSSARQGSVEPSWYLSEARRLMAPYVFPGFA